MIDITLTTQNFCESVVTSNICIGTIYLVILVDGALVCANTKPFQIYFEGNY